MGATQTLDATPLAEIKLQMEHPTPEAIHSRALEVFDGVELAREWLDTPLMILAGKTPAECAASGDNEQMREVLRILTRIDYGMYS